MSAFCYTAATITRRQVMAKGAKFSFPKVKIKATKMPAKRAVPARRATRKAH